MVVLWCKFYTSKRAFFYLYPYRVIPVLHLYWAKLQPSQCQNFEAPFRISPAGLRFSRFLLQRELPDGVKVERDWIIFHYQLNIFFCFICSPFGDHSSNDTGLLSTVWKNSSRPIKSMRIRRIKQKTIWHTSMSKATGA